MLALGVLVNDVYLKTTEVLRSANPWAALIKRLPNPKYTVLLVDEGLDLAMPRPKDTLRRSTRPIP